MVPSHWYSKRRSRNHLHPCIRYASVGTECRQSSHPSSHIFPPRQAASLDTSFVVSSLRNDSAPFPSARTRPIWETSNIPHLFLTLRHSGIMPSNQTGRSKPAYSTMLPCFLWYS